MRRHERARVLPENKVSTDHGARKCRVAEEINLPLLPVSVRSFRNAVKAEGSEMGRTSTIPLPLQSEIVARYLRKESSDSIAKWLGEQGHPITGRTVRTYLGRYLRERGQAVKAHVREQLEAVTGTGLEALPALMRRAVRDEDRASALFEKSDDQQEKLAALAEARKQRAEQRALVDLALHYSGADAPDAAPQNLADLLGKILERNRGEVTGEMAGPSEPVLQ